MENRFLLLMIFAFIAFQIGLDSEMIRKYKRDRMEMYRLMADEERATYEKLRQMDSLTNSKLEMTSAHVEAWMKIIEDEKKTK